MNKLGLIGLAGFAFASASQLRAGTEMVEPERAPAPRYSYDYAPPPPAVVYYAPPPVRVVVAPAYAYYGPRYRAYGHQRFYGRRSHWHGGHRRW
jgi:hypothetical protein